MSELLKLENISKYYTSGQSVVMGLQNVSLSFSAGEFVAVTGESGSGKSTLAKVIAGILPYESGEMTVEGKPTSHYGQPDWELYRCGRISFISQSYDILPGCSVFKNVVSALVLTGMESARAAEGAEEILNRVDLLGQKNRKAAKLSSGQKQRLSIARALAKPAPILIADEPTGNLDPENSAKIIGLLADAAKERLVIMVTHDFEEVKAHVTRQICIREGVVASDLCLRQECEVAAPMSVDRKENRGLSFYTAWLQMESRPIWSFIMLLFFALTAFAMFVFLGTFVANVDDSFTRLYDTSAFPNGDSRRIVVMRQDGEELLQEDLEVLKGLENVVELERFGLLSDINYYYREDQDYFYHYIPKHDQAGNPTGEIEITITLGEPELFLRTIPYGMDTESFLTGGRLPENMYEVVAHGDESLIGTKMQVLVSDNKKWAPGSYIRLNVTVVGVTDREGNLFFDSQLGRVFMSETELGRLIAPVYSLDFLEDLMIEGDSLEGRFLCSQGIYQEIWTIVWLEQGRDSDISMNQLIREKEFPFCYYEDPDQKIMLKAYGVHNSTYINFIMVEPEVFERITPELFGNEIALTIKDYAYTDRVLQKIYDLGYSAISPYRLGTTKQDPKLAAERLATLKICILAALAVFLLQIVVMRAMFGMEEEEFRLLANLGLRCRMAKRSVLWQILAFTAGGQILAVAVISFCCYLGIERIVFILKYLQPNVIVLFMIIHLATGLLTSLWIQAAVARQVFPSGLQYRDLKMNA